jgi:drug/metabolite transporter (DMT)-like permease
MAIVALLGAVAIWGFNILVVKEAVTVWPQVPFIAVRFWIATLVFIPLHFRDTSEADGIDAVHRAVDGDVTSTRRGTGWTLTRCRSWPKR